MVVFTYKDYLEYENSTMLCVREDGAEYIIETEEKIHQYKDKIFKEILSNKKEFIKFLQKYLGIKEFIELTENDIEKYNKEFITSNFKKRESDIIYKISKLNMYIILEHQSKIDYKMPQRITEYSVELMRDISENDKGKKVNETVIVPIVLYTGEQKWNLEDTNEIRGRYGYKIFKYSEYNLIDIRNYSKEELIEDDTGLSKALLFEKVKTKDEFKKDMNKIIKKDLTVEEVKYIQMILRHSNKVKKFIPEGAEKYIKKLEKGGEEDMKFEKFLIEWLQDEKREGRKEGRKEGRIEGRKEGEKSGIAKAIKQMVKEMIKKQMSDDDIMEITKISKEELEKLKTA